MLYSSALPTAKPWRGGVPLAQRPGGGFTRYRLQLRSQMFRQPGDLRQLLMFYRLTQRGEIGVCLFQISLQQSTAGTEKVSVKARA